MLVPAERNARTHSQEQIKQLVASIQAFGWTNPILIDEDHAIIAGHGRLEAARLAGLSDVPTITLTGLSAAQKRALAIADNKLALNAGWDDDLLRLELGELGLDGFDLSLIGFSDFELKDILADRTEGLTDPDEVPEPPAEPVTKPGDVWLLGRHRLVCGDCTDASVVEAVLGGVRPAVCLTDPPYGVKRDKGFEGFEGFGGFGPPIARRKYVDSWDQHRPSRECFEMLLGSAPSVLIFGGNFFSDYLPVGNHWIVWDKLNTMPTFGDCELVWTNIKRNSVKKHTVEYNGLIGKEKERHHPTQKPVELISKLLMEYTKDAQAVYDPFVGSGTTIIASEMTGRACHAIEISPVYCDVAITRWQNFTGVIAVSATTGQPFATLATERLAVAPGLLDPPDPPHRPLAFDDLAHGEPKARHATT